MKRNSNVPGVTLRKFPFPYRCALAICSDIDGTFRERFLELHNFLNTARKTKWGSGLGLEIGDSFWMYSAHPDKDDGWTYFEGESDQRSANCELIKTFVQSGYIDSLHTYGQFSQKGGFRREMAKRAVEELDKEDMHITVWLNHGDNHNFQNIGGLGWGDLPEEISGDGARTPSLEYHTDLAIPYGIKFLWCFELTSIIGQDRAYGVRENYFSDGIFRHPLRLVMVLWCKLRGRPIPLPENGRNELLTLVTLRDGRRAYTFRRFGYWEKDRIEHLAELLSEENLEKLISAQGYMITYMHLGKSYSGEVFPENVLSTLRLLAEKYRVGDIYVTTTAKLLEYNLVYHSLNWEARKRRDSIEILITGMRDELRGETLTPVLEELNGITFYTPDAERTKVILGDEEIEIKKNPPDCFRHESVMIPISRLSYPDFSYQKGGTKDYKKKRSHSSETTRIA